MHPGTLRMAVFAGGVGVAAFANTKSLLFDGAERVEFGTADILADGATSATWNWWMKTVDSGAENPWARSDNTLNVPKMQLASGFLRSYVGTGSSFFRTSSIVVNDGVWHFISVAYDGGTNSNNIYIDGVDRTGALTGIPPASLPATAVMHTIGSRAGGAAGYTGNIDELTIFSSFFGLSEHQELYNNRKSFDPRTHSESANILYYNRLGDDATWNGSVWTFPDLVGSATGTSVNMEFADVVSDVPS